MLHILKRDFPAKLYSWKCNSLPYPAETHRDVRTCSVANYTCLLHDLTHAQTYPLWGSETYLIGNPSLKLHIAVVGLLRDMWVWGELDNDWSNVICCGYVAVMFMHNADNLAFKWNI